VGEFVQTSLRCEPYSYNLCILTQQRFRYTLYLCGMVSHTTIILALLPIPTHHPNIPSLFVLYGIELCHTNLTFLLTLYQHGTPKLLILLTALHPVLLSHVLLLIL